MKYNLEKDKFIEEEEEGGGLGTSGSTSSWESSLLSNCEEPFETKLTTFCEATYSKFS